MVKGGADWKVFDTKNMSILNIFPITKDEVVRKVSDTTRKLLLYSFSLVKSPLPTNKRRFSKLTNREIRRSLTST